MFNNDIGLGLYRLMKWSWAVINLIDAWVNIVIGESVQLLYRGIILRYMRSTSAKKQRDKGTDTEDKVVPGLALY